MIKKNSRITSRDCVIAQTGQKNGPENEAVHTPGAVDSPAGQTWAPCRISARHTKPHRAASNHRSAGLRSAKCGLETITVSQLRCSKQSSGLATVRNQISICSTSGVLALLPTRPLHPLTLHIGHVNCLNTGIRSKFLHRRHVGGSNLIPVRQQFVGLLLQLIEFLQL